jgi:hypothetical protein
LIVGATLTERFLEAAIRSCSVDKAIKTNACLRLVPLLRQHRRFWQQRSTDAASATARDATAGTV